MNNFSSLYDAGMVVVKSTGGAGLGDLIRALLSGLHYAGVSGRRIAVRWDDGMYGCKGEDVFPSLFRLVDIPVAKLADMDQGNVFPKIWGQNLHTPLNDLYGRLRHDVWNRSWALRELSFDQTRFDYDEEVLVMWDFDGFAASWNAADPVRRYGSSVEEALRLLAQRHVRPSGTIQERVTEFHKRNFRNPMIGVHVRKTCEIGGDAKQVDDQSYLKAIDAIRRRHPDAGIFLATDNAAVEDSLRGRYPDLVTRSKWFPAPGQPIHFASQGPDRLARAMDAVVEMFLLASCHYLVYPALSSFSLTARYLSGLPDEQVVVLRKIAGVRQWWEQTRRLRALQSGWVRA